MREAELPDADERPVHSLSPEQRRREAIAQRITRMMGPGTRAWVVARRVVVGAYNDGFIHAGNLAYMALLAIFPFFITGAAIFTAFGEHGEEQAMVDAVLFALPPVVGNVIEPVAQSVIHARSGWLLWIGGAIGLWTVGSLIETIRDILRRAYGTRQAQAFWRNRLLSSVLIVAAVILLLLSLIAQVMIGAAQEVIAARLPELSARIGELELSRYIAALALFGSIYTLFFALTPRKYRAKRYPKWPGALVTTLWWVGMALAMPPLLRSFFTYDLTYGALSGIMIALFFFWLVGLGVVIGAELNAALAVTPEEEASRTEQSHDARSARAQEETAQ